MLVRRSWKKFLFARSPNALNQEFFQLRRTNITYPRCQYKSRLLSVTYSLSRCSAPNGPWFSSASNMPVEPDPLLLKVPEKVCSCSPALAWQLGSVCKLETECWLVFCTAVDLSVDVDTREAGDMICTRRKSLSSSMRSACSNSTVRSDPLSRVLPGSMG